MIHFLNYFIKRLKYSPLLSMNSCICQTSYHSFFIIFFRYVLQYLDYLKLWLSKSVWYSWHDLKRSKAKRDIIRRFSWWNFMFYFPDIGLSSFIFLNSRRLQSRFLHKIYIIFCSMKWYIYDIIFYKQYN